jgi:hypothetical protein
MSAKTEFWALISVSILNIIIVFVCWSVDNFIFASINSFSAGFSISSAIPCLQEHGKSLWCWRHAWNVIEVYGPYQRGHPPDAIKVMKCEKCGEIINL